VARQKSVGGASKKEFIDIEKCFGPRWSGSDDRPAEFHCIRPKKSTVRKSAKDQMLLNGSPTHGVC